MGAASLSNAARNLAHIPLGASDVRRLPSFHRAVKMRETRQALPFPTKKVRQHRARDRESARTFAAVSPLWTLIVVAMDILGGLTEGLHHDGMFDMR